MPPRATCRPGLPRPLGPGLPLPADTASAQPSLPKNERPHKSQQQAGAGCIAAMGRNFSLSHDTLPLTARTAVPPMTGNGGGWAMTCLYRYGFYYSYAYMLLKTFSVLRSFGFFLQGVYKPVQRRVRPLRRTRQLRAAFEFRVFPEEISCSNVLGCG